MLLAYVFAELQHILNCMSHFRIKPNFNEINPYHHQL